MVFPSLSYILPRTAVFDPMTKWCLKLFKNSWSSWSFASNRATWASSEWENCSQECWEKKLWPVRDPKASVYPIFTNDPCSKWTIWLSSVSSQESIEVFPRLSSIVIIRKTENKIKSKEQMDKITTKQWRDNWGILFPALCSSSGSCCWLEGW